MRRLATRPLLAVLIFSFFAACAADEPDSTAAIQAAIEKYLSERSDLSINGMKVAVDQVRYDGDSAEADVTISASKDPQAKMQMAYELEKGPQGWQVKPSSATGHAPGMPPAPGGGLPPGHPPAMAPPGSAPPSNAPGADLPPGHPPVGGAPAAPNDPAAPVSDGAVPL